MVLRQLEQLLVAHSVPEALNCIVGARSNSCHLGSCAGDTISGVAKSDLSDCPRLRGMEEKSLSSEYVF